MKKKKKSEKFPEANMWVGIESGMYENEKKEKVDAACILIRWSKPIQKEEATKVTVEDFEEVVIWSDEILIPQNFKGGNDGEWSIYKDPHSIITEGKRSRADFIRDAILKWKIEKNEFENW